MKRYSRLFIAALAAFGLASCSQELDQQIQTPQGNLVTVNFGAEAAIEGATKATLTPNEDDTFFKSAWENGDELGIKYSNDGMGNEEKVITATWNETSYSFSTALPEFTGRWIYRAAYPAPEADGSVEFGSSRTQKGNAYNSKYDLMRGSVMTEAPAGKTDEGKDIIFDMTRETAIAYFHFTSSLNEEVVSAKLSVAGGSIANSSVKTDYHNSFVFSGDKSLNEITITFEDGTAPKASDFKLWYNVRPTSYGSMTLEVETTGHKMTINRNSEDVYEAGRLYKVVKDIDDKWVAKGGETPTESSYTIEFYSEAKNDTEITNKTKASTIVSKGSEYLTDQPFTSSTKSYYGGTNKVLKVGTRSANGSITMDLSELGKCAATKKIILSAKQYSTGKRKTIGVGNSQKQQPGDDYTDLEFALDGSPLTSIKLNSDGYICVRSITVVKGIDKRHNINVAEVEGGTLSASAIKAEEGTEITLTADPQLGYEFNGDWSVVATDGTAINVVDNKFIMPAQDVTVSGTFTSNIKYDHAGTENDPYNVLDVLKLIETLGNGANSSEINAKGVIKSIKEVSTTYKNATYTIGDETTSETVTIYRGKYIDGADFTSTDQIKIGDEVVIKGRVTNYNGSKQFSTGSRIVSLKRMETCATPVINIDENGVASITCATEGATIRYTVGDAPADPTETSDVFSSATLTDGQTIKAIAFAEGYKPSAVASQKYTTGGESPNAYTLQFGPNYNSEKTNEYSNNWSVTCDGFTWKMTNWNNYNNGWTYVKAGPKGNIKAHAMIETAAAMPEAISTITITVDNVTNGSITSIVLKSSTTNDFTSGTTIETKSSITAKGEVVFHIPSPQNGLYYQLDFTLNNTTSGDKNGKSGVAQVSKVVYTNN